MAQSPWRRLVSDAELLAFTRHLHAMLGAGIPILSALTICHERCVNNALAEALKLAHERIGQGSSIASSLELSPRIFSPIYRALLAAGESAGILERSLECLASELSSRITLRRNLTAAATYPSIVLATLSLVTIALLVWVVPTFEDLFSDAGTTLPWLTRIVIRLSRLISTYGACIFAASVVAALVAIRALRSNQHLAERMERIAHRIPLVKTVMCLSFSARISSTLGALIRSGVPIIDALTTTSRVVPSRLYTEEILRVRTEVANGSSLSASLRTSPIVSPITIDYITVGERSGQLEVMLLHSATQLEQELATLIERLTQLAEPILLLTVGIIVGILVVAMYLPIFQIGELVSR